MNINDWQTEFRKVYDCGVVAWNEGRRSAQTMFDDKDAAFLATIGCTAQELFDFVDDFHRYGEPDFETTLAVAAIRRDYFLNVMGGRRTGRVGSSAILPAKTAEVDGIAWLPRIIAKARLKLRGEMPADLMYGCAGDRPFLQKMNLDLLRFLKLVWECGDDNRRIVEAVKKSARF
ncbi:MAG: DUF5069 domain-containing protein [Verrucomicrobia bacterium]|nr:DUF5069 domain-containing protein [Verrucomicrobiota bacterium]